MYCEFFSIPPSFLPQNCSYFFKVTVINLGLPKGTLQNLAEIIDISKLNAARPFVLWTFPNNEDDLWVELHSNCVVEINERTGEIGWYRTYETEDMGLVPPEDES